MDVGAVLVIAVVALLVVLGFRRHSEAAARARLLRRIGFGVLAVESAFLGVFVVAEAMTDPGGWAGIGLVAAWLVPLVVLVAFARLRPDPAGPLLAGLVAAVVLTGAWFGADPDGWRSFEDRHGPVRTIATFALGVVLGVFGLRRTAVAGALLVALGTLPVALARLGQGGFGSLAAASSAPVVTGLLYLWSAAFDRTTGATPTAGGGVRRPKVA